MPGRGIDNLEALQSSQRRYQQPSSVPAYRPLEYPVPPFYRHVVENPAIREAVQAQESSAEPERHRYRGSRKAYIPGIEGQYLDKPTLRHILNTMRPYREQAAYDVFGKDIYGKHDNGTFYHSPEVREKAQRKYDQEREWAKKETEREEFSLLHQYRLSKNDSPLQYPDGSLGFGGAGESASKFINGFGPDIKGWKDMSPSEKDEFIVRENEKRNTPERIARRQKGQASARLAEDLQASRRQSEQESRNLNAMSPAAREQRNYNRQVQDYMGKQNAAEYKNQARFIQDSKQLQAAQNMSQNLSIPEPVINELITMMNSRPTQYIPIRRRPSINDRVMSSFDENMFNPEFISEE